MKTYILPIILLVLIISCNDNERAPVNHGLTTKKDKIKEEPTENVEVEYSSENNEFNPYLGEFVDSPIIDIIDSLNKLYDKVAYYTEVDGRYYFYVINGKWVNQKDEKFINNGNFKIGLISETYEKIIPIKYDKIYNIGGTVSNSLVVEINKKRGLYSIKGDVIIEAKYDNIYPNTDPDVLAQVRQGNSFGWINSKFIASFEKSSHLNKNLFKSPFESEICSSWSFDINSKNIHQLYSPTYIYYSNDANEGNGIVFTPSFLFDLGFMPELLTNIINPKSKDADFGLMETKGKVQKPNAAFQNIRTMIGEFYSYGVDARDYQSTEYNLITVNNKTNKTNKIYFMSDGYRGNYCSGNSYQFISPTLFEVKDIKRMESKDSPYDNMTNYTYYKINEDGDIIKLSSKRMYDFTKYIKMDSTYFKGCFAIHKEYSGYDEPNLIVSEHLSIEDLDIMRNEIFAEYGYKFKSPKWQEYFKKKSWYNGINNNVDAELTDIDKFNIKIILQQKMKMTGREEKYTKRAETHYSAAG